MDKEVENLIVDGIKVYGVKTNVTMVTDLDNLKPIRTFTYDSDSKVRNYFVQLTGSKCIIGLLHRCTTQRDQTNIMALSTG